jgi:hypothetical protein
MDSLTPIMTAEAVSVPGVISGSNILRDLLNRISERLSGDCNLRASDAYAGYSFQAVITIQLHDVYACEVATVVKGGQMNPQRPVTRVDLGAQVVAEPDPGNLERPIDPAGFMEPEPLPGPTDTRGLRRGSK